jgi:hypothetical protein
VTQLLAFIGMAGGDQVRAVAVSGDETRWSPRWQALSKSDEMFAWIAETEAAGTVQLGAELASIAQQIPPASLLIVVSDWWTDNLETAVLAAAEHGHQLVALHIEAPEEADPTLLGDGLIHLVDSENGEVIDVVLDDRTVDAYKAAYAERTVGLHTRFVKWGGFYVRATAGVCNLRDFFLTTLRSAGIVS